MYKSILYIAIFTLGQFAEISLYAQTGKVGINTTTPAAMLHVKDSSVVFTGQHILPNSPGAPPVSGAGIRMMWYPDKAAFRAGQAIGNEWNKDSIGLLSIAYGYDVRAKGQNAIALGYGSWATSSFSVAIGANARATGYSSTAFGPNNNASGAYSTAMGFDCTASGLYATALGYQTVASQQVSMAMGQLTIASEYAATAMGNGTKAKGYSSTSTGLSTVAEGFGSFSAGHDTKAFGDLSLAMGRSTIARSYGSFVLGQYNDTSAISTISWDLNDPVLIIGNGTSHFVRSNALTILKNGKTGINTSTPNAMLHVIKDIPTNGPYNTNAAAIFEGDQGSFIQLSNDHAIQSGILSGNEATPIRSALIFTADSSVLVRAGGNLNKMIIKKDGNVGIGTTSPQKLLHISGGAGGDMYNAEADLIVEDNNHTYIQFSSPNNSASGFLSGNTLTDIRSALLFMADSTVQIRAGGNTTRLTIDEAGNTNTTGEIHRTSTGNANMVPICYGSVSPGTPPVINSGTGNFSVANPVTGQYDITITGENYTNSTYSSIVTPVSSSFRTVSVGAAGNNLVIRIFNSVFAQVDNQFHFVVYKN